MPASSSYSATGTGARPQAQTGSSLWLTASTCPWSLASSARYRRSRSPSGLSWEELRPDYDRLVLGDLEGYRPDICVLAGYMLIVSGEMCRRFSLLNLHPALPDGPIGTWQSVTWELIRQRSTRTGAMIHLATEELDRGPVVSYCTVPITGPGFDCDWRELDGVDLDEVMGARGEDLPLFQKIRRAQYVREPYLILETLRAVADGRVTVRNGSTLDQLGNPLTSDGIAGLCLDEDIGRAMAEDGIA